MSLDLVNPFAGLSPLALGVMAVGLFFAALARGYLDGATFDGLVPPEAMTQLR